MVMDNVFLCGFMGAGKTTVGKILSKELEKRFWDTDAAIEEELGMPIIEIFERYGECFFRRNESNLIHEICEHTGSVVSLGGGSLDISENVKTIRESNGCIVFFDVSFKIVQKRLEGDTTRPIFLSNSESELQRFYEKRKKVCMQNADIIIDANGSPFEVMKRILYGLKRYD